MADFTVDPSAIRRIFADQSGPVGREMTRVALRVQNRAKQLAPVDTGRLRASITHELRVVNDVVIAVVGTNVEYARIVHEGRGPITTRRARGLAPNGPKALRFKPKGGGSFIFRKSVGPAEAQPFLRDALRDVVG